jgi:hypothetical protein
MDFKTKVCPSCRLVLFVNSFTKDNSRKDKLAYNCRLCKNQQMTEWRQNNPINVERINKNKREYGRIYSKMNRESSNKNYVKYTSTVKGHLATLIRNARARAKKRNLAFEIDHSFLLTLWENQEGKCSVTGVMLTTKKGTGRNPTNASLDRIIPKNGYIPENVRLACYRVNEMKSDGTDSDLKKWCKLILDD